MGNSGLRVRRRLGFLLLALVFLACFPGTGKAVKPLKPPIDVPKAFRQLEASVAGLRFFETPTSQVVPMNARVYRTEFFKAETHYIWWEMCLDTKAKLDHPVTLIMWITWQRADGTEHYQSLVFTIPPNLPKPCLAGIWQDDRPGGWLPGSYLVTIQIDDIQVAEGCFEILQKFLKEDLHKGKEGQLKQ
jgi:hypothetical protein